MSIMKKYAAQCSTITAIAGFVLGIGASFFFLHAPAGRLGDQRDPKSEYKYISPLLACADPSLSTLPNDKADELERSLTSILALMKAQNEIRDAGLYFRELNNGPWIGINHGVKFTPGSLLKVPLAISVYEHAEEDRSLLAEKIAYDSSTNPLSQHFLGNSLPSGEYTMEELVAQMLENSDNAATIGIASNLPEQDIEESYSRLGITAPFEGLDYTMSVRDYASFFRILYNGTYLSHDDSETILSLLAKSTFTQGIVAGLPPGIPVAHKFGERSLTDDGLTQLHDCGIVYMPNRPYVLCIMLRGTDLDILAESIAKLSKKVYDFELDNKMSLR